MESADDDPRLASAPSGMRAQYRVGIVVFSACEKRSRIGVAGHFRLDSSRL
jgi:hypothetical protein